MFACTSQFHAMNWKQLNHFKGRVWSVTFSPSGKYFATSSAETSLTIFDQNFSVLWQTNDLIKEVASIAFSPDEEYLAIPKYKNETDVGLIDLNSFQAYHILSGHTDWVTCLDFSPDGLIVATGSDDASVRIWKKNWQIVYVSSTNSRSWRKYCQFMLQSKRKIFSRLRKKYYSHLSKRV
jgi:WD40 repeat protein